MHTAQKSDTCDKNFCNQGPLKIVTFRIPTANLNLRFLHLVLFTQLSNLSALPHPLLKTTHFPPNVENEASYLAASSSISDACLALRTVAFTGNGSLRVW